MHTLNTLGAGTLAKAYDLDIYQCIDLVKKVDCWSAKNKKLPPSHFNSFEEVSRYYAEQLMGEPDAAVKMMHGAAIGWREGEATDFIQNEIQRYQEYIFIGFEGENWIDTELKNTVFNLILPIVRIFFISQLSVDKTQAVHLLNEHGFSLIHEVRGLTRAGVEKILAAKMAVDLSSSDTMPSKVTVLPQAPTLDSVPSTIGPQGGSNKQTDKINATKQSCSPILEQIAQGQHLDDQNTIGREEFVQLVKTSMIATGRSELYHVTTARNEFANSSAIEQFKRKRGRKKGK